MKWANIYDGTVRHMLPQTRPYADTLRAFVLDNHAPLTTWIAEAEAMLEGFGRVRDDDDLTMLAAMLERGTLAMLPAVAMGGMIKRAIADNPRELAIVAISHGRMTAMMPLDKARATDLTRSIAGRIVQDVMRAVDWLNMAALNAATPPGSRPDLTSYEQRMRMEPIWIMAASVVLPAVPFDRIVGDMVPRMAA